VRGVTSPEPMPEPDPIHGGSSHDADRAPVIPLHGPPRVRVGGADDMLALIPYLLGFRPEQSLVVMVLRQHRVVLTARMDLPRSMEECEQVADHFARVAVRHDAEDCLVAVYSTEWEHAHLVLMTLALSDDLPVVTALHCDDDQYRMLAPDGTMEGPYGFDPRASAAAAAAVVAGLSVAPDRESLAARIMAGPRELTDQVVAAAEDVDLPEEQDERRDLMDRTVSRCLPEKDAVAELSDSDCALLGLLCLDLEVRDVAWLRMERETASRHLALWIEVSRRVPPVLTAAPVCLAGMASWLDGDGALAWCCAERAEEEHPGYGLAGLLGEILAATLHPGAWHELAEEMRTLYR